MLLLTRKPQERILIGEDIVITIIRVDKNNVRMGVEAPKNMKVIRIDAQRHMRVEESNSP